MNCSCAYEDARNCATAREQIEPCECGCHMTDDEAMDLIETTPVPTCAHPRLTFGEEQVDAMNWVTVPWSCPDCGKFGAQRFHRGEATRERLRAIANLLSRHHAELAECEHGALKGRCLVDPCETEDFESDHVVNRAVEVEQQIEYGASIGEAADMLSFDTDDFRDLLAYAWVGARVLKAAGVESPHLYRTERHTRAPEGRGDDGRRTRTGPLHCHAR